MERLSKWIFYGCLVAMPLSCWQRDSFDDNLDVLPDLQAVPAQVQTQAAPFDTVVNDVHYQIEPLHDYELHGLVVSYQHHNGERMLHRRWNDHLNAADVCVVWGANATSLDLNTFDFWNGQFTCFFRTRDEQAWRRFDPSGLANNHLITDDPDLRDLIDQVEIGDQIRIQGWLANYRQDDGFVRGTSTSREDTGNGACETIYVREFQILARMDNPWRTIFDFSLIAAIALALLWILRVVRGTS